MLRLVMGEIITFYDGIQLAFMSIGRSRSAKKFIVAHSIDDGVYLAARISSSQLSSLKKGEIDVKTVMKNPFCDEYYIALDPLVMPANHYNNLQLDEYFSIPVQYDPVFDRWAIPSAGLFLTDL